MQIAHGACLLHLSEHHGDASPGATVFLRITGLELAPWNARLMQLTDPFGNRLRFNEDLQ